MTLAVYALVRLLFSFKRLRSTYLRREKIQRQQRQCLFSAFVFGNGGGEHAKGRGTSGQSWIRFWIPLPGFQIPGTGFLSLLLKFGFWIRIFSRVPDSLSCILDSKIQDSRFHKKKLPGFRNPDFLDMEREEEAPAVNALVFPFSTISDSA